MQVPTPPLPSCFSITSLQLFLEAPDDIQCFKFNPYKPSFVIGGCLNGLVRIHCAIVLACLLLYWYCIDILLHCIIYNSVNYCTYVYHIVFIIVMQQMHIIVHFQSQCMDDVDFYSMSWMYTCVIGVRGVLFQTTGSCIHMYKGYTNVCTVHVYTK